MLGWNNNPQRLVFALVFLAVLIRAVVFVYGGFQAKWKNRPFGYEHTMIAVSLLKGEGYASPFSPPATGPTMWHPPIIASVLAGIYAVFGVCTLASYVCWVVFNLLLTSAGSLLVEAVGRKAFGGATAAVAQAFYALNPFDIYKFQFMPANLADEVFYTVLILFGIWGFTVVRSRVTRGLLAGGLLIGHPMAFLVFVLLLGIAYLGRKVSLRDLCLILLFSGVTISPLVVRNYVVLGGFALSKTNFFFEAYTYNAPSSEGIQTVEIQKRYHPQTNVEQRRLMATLGELAYVRLCRDKFLKMVWNEPRRLIKLVLKRINYFWINFVSFAKVLYPERPFLAVLAIQVYYILSLGSILYCLWRRLAKKPGNALQWGVILIPFFYSTPYLLTHVALRYRTPIEPIIMIMIAAATLDIFKLGQKQAALIMRQRSIKKAA